MLREPAYALLVALGIIFLAGSAHAKTWIERVDIEVRDDLTSHTRLIMLQSIDSYFTQKEPKSRKVEVIRNELSRICGYEIQVYQIIGARGFMATVDFATKGELEHAMSCTAVIVPFIKVHLLGVDEKLWGTDYELEIEVLKSNLVREVQVRMPGKMELGQATIPPPKLVSSDTLLWEIWGTSSQQKTTKASRLTARSHKSAIRIEWILSVIGALFGSGIIWRVWDARRKKGS